MSPSRCLALLGGLIIVTLWLIPHQEAYGLALKQVGTVHALVFGRGLIITIHGRHAVPFVCVVVDTGVAKAVKVIKTTGQGEESAMHTQVPFTEYATRIAR